MFKKNIQTGAGGESLPRRKLTFSSPKEFLFIFCIPVLVLIIFMCVNIVLSVQSTKSVMENTVLSSFKSYSSFTDGKVHSIADNTLLFDSNEEISKILRNSDGFSETDTELLQNFLNNFRKSSSLIGNCAVLSQNTDTVVTSDGSYTRNFSTENAGSPPTPPHTSMSSTYTTARLTKYSRRVPQSNRLNQISQSR